MTKQQLVNEFESECTLQSYAAESAINALASNWADALYDGAKLDDLLGDVDIVIEHLERWRNNVVAHCPTTFRK